MLATNLPSPISFNFTCHVFQTHYSLKALSSADFYSWPVNFSFLSSMPRTPSTSTTLHTLFSVDRCWFSHPIRSRRLLCFTYIIRRLQLLKENLEELGVWSRSGLHLQHLWFWKTLSKVLISLVLLRLFLFVHYSNSVCLFSQHQISNKHIISSSPWE